LQIRHYSYRREQSYLEWVSIREVQQYLEHVSAETTMIYTHVIRNLAFAEGRPLDLL